ncbi:Mu transposase domain-containing protein [Kitasatospora azatica]|uniref:Mu transposase domain-containing protein n=1 Tax=Kitasatospora azatica TaxID=58347 RepID=UPI00055D6DDF|nr:hypothetical protein [Kitasatospora azatica]
MLTREEYVELRRLSHQGWSISAIARHLGRDRKTVRSHLGGERVAGVRSPAQDEFQPFEPYCRQRLADDPHLVARALFEEVVDLAYRGGYSTFTRALRKRRLRPRCELCDHGSRIHRNPTERSAHGEVRLDWLRLPDPPVQWDCGPQAHVLMGEATPSDCWRAVLAENEEFPQVIEALDQLLRRLGSAGRYWRLGRIPGASFPSTGKVTPEFDQVARYYRVEVEASPGSCHHHEDRRLAVHRWWRTVRSDTRIHVAQEALDRLTEQWDAGVAAGGTIHADPQDNDRPAGNANGMARLPADPFPAHVRAIRTVSSQNLILFRGNAYALPADLGGAVVEVRWRLDEPYLSITTKRGAVLVRHPLAPRGAGLVVAGRGHTIALERPTRTARTSSPSCRANTPRPISAAAIALADALRACVPAGPEADRNNEP